MAGGDGGRLCTASFVPSLPPRAEAVVEVLRTVAERHGTTPAAVALAWVLGQDHVDSVILGFSAEAQLDANVRVGALQLAPSDAATLDEVSAPALAYRQSWTSAFLGGFRAPPRSWGRRRGEGAGRTPARPGGNCEGVPYVATLTRLPAEETDRCPVLMTS